MDYTWSRTTRYLIVLIGLLGLSLVIYAGRALVGPIVIAGLLAYVLNPAVELLTGRTRIRRPAAVLMVYMLFLAAVIAIPAIATPIIVSQIRGLTLDLQRIETRVEALLADPISVAGIELLPAGSMADVGQLVAEALAPAASGALDLLGEVTTNLIWILVILVTIYYLLRDGPRLGDWLVGLAPPGLQPDLRRLRHEIDFVWSAYLRGQLTLSLVVGVLTAIATAAVGLPGALVLGIVAGILDVIPSLGPTVAGAISVVVAFFLGSTYLPLSNAWFGLLVLALFIFIQQVENIWLRPQIMGHSLRIHPGIVFVAVLGALALIGILGALVIIPLLATLGLIGRYVHRRMLGLNPWEQAPAPTKETVEKKPGGDTTQVRYTGSPAQADR